ncbi:MAG TPA: hypothetical protein VMU84_20275 [Thermoanaerobaculia bacterium]|nr:hypothetical protein [Thermoanaerobaculia bacterium]
MARSLQAAAALSLGMGSVSAMRRDDQLKAGTLDLNPSDVCTLTCAQTLGPCYYSGTVVRQDLTEGKAGLSTLLAFLVVNADTCQPIENAAIDIWHTDAGGVYSAPISTMCNGINSPARQQTFCRGVQMTASDGWAHFKTVYRGWYSGRTPHIHATIRAGGSEMVTTQFYFPDDLSTHIYHTHPAYTSRPNRDTTNTSDNVIGGSASRVTPFLFRPKLFGENSLVALKVIAIRSLRTTCAA